MYKLETPHRSCSNRAAPAARQRLFRVRTCRIGRSIRLDSGRAPGSRRLPLCPNWANSTSSGITRTSRRLNMSIDGNFYPLGSCTMKYNPKRNERLAGVARAWRVCTRTRTSRRSKGCSRILFRPPRVSSPRSPACLAVSLQPAAGAQGELTALLCAAAYFRDKGEKRTARFSSPIVPTGPTPPRPTSPGFQAVTIKSNERGLVDIEDFKAHLDDETAVFMMTNPNTVGLFDPQIKTIAGLASRPRGLALSRRRQHERHPRPGPARRHGCRSDALQPPQDLLRTTRRRRPRRRPNRGSRLPCPLSCPPAVGGPGRGWDLSPRPRPTQDDRPSSGLLSAMSASFVPGLLLHHEPGA